MAISEAPAKTEQGAAAGDTQMDYSPQVPFNKGDYRQACQHRPGLYAQITEGRVSFDHIAKAWRIRNDPDYPVEKDEERASRVLEYLARRQFSTEHEGIQKDCWSIKPWAGCALTGDGWVHSVLNSDDPELVLYDSRVHQLCRDAHRTFEVAARRNRNSGSDQRSTAHIFRRHDSTEKAKRDLQESGEMLYSVLTRVISTASVLEDPNATQQKRDEALDAVRIEWKIVYASVVGMIQRQARFEYFEGVGLGALITIPALALAGWLAVRYGAKQFSEAGAFTAAIIGGAAGAVISVTQRMTANTLVLDFAAPKYQKVALGALRPLVGAIFAAVVYFTIIGGLLAVEARTNQEASVALAFFAVMGFAAGFSERFATDVLDRARSGVLPTSREQQGAENPDEPSELLSRQPRHVLGPTVNQESDQTQAPPGAVADNGAQPPASDKRAEITPG